MFTGGFVINPVTEQHIPVFIADYVMMGYGTGAVMGVPGQDERDWEFAETYNLPIVRTVQPPDDFEGKAFLGDGPAINSGFLDGMDVDAAKDAIIAWLEEGDLGERTVTYKLRDWLFSRQRYWGEPFPIVYDEHGPVALPDDELPVELPEISDFEPTTSDDPDALPEPPLARATNWVEVELDLHGPEWAGYGRGRQVYLRETNTMPQWAGSCWYYLRYLDPTNEDAMVDPAVERAWAGGTRADGSPKTGLVDVYVGGVEHAVLHLLYARFWHKVLFDLGQVSTPEPFQRLVNQGYILAPAYQDERGSYVEATEVEERDGRYFARRGAGAARVREDGQEPEERGRARRHLPRLRRRHVAPVRDVHGSARRVAPVEHRRHHRRAPVPAAAVAQRHRRRDRRRSRRRRPDRRRDEPAAPSHDRRGAHRHGRAGLQHRDRAAVRAEQPPDASRAAAGERAACGRDADGADGRAARAAHRRGVVGADSATPTRWPTSRSRPPIPRCSSTR